MLEIYKVCADCLFHHETGNHSEWDQAFSPEEWETRRAELDASTQRQADAGRRWCSSLAGEEEEFSIAWCEWCGTRLAGPRFRTKVSVDAG